MEPAPNEHRGPAASIFHEIFAFFFFIFPFKQAKVLVLREIFISNFKIDFFLVLRSLFKSVCLSVCLYVYIQAIIILFARLLFPHVLNFFYLDV